MLPVNEQKRLGSSFQARSLSIEHEPSLVSKDCQIRVQFELSINNCVTVWSQISRTGRVLCGADQVLRVPECRNAKKPHVDSIYLAVACHHWFFTWIECSPRTNMFGIQSARDTCNLYSKTPCGWRSRLPQLNLRTASGTHQLTITVWLQGPDRNLKTS